MTTIAGHVVSPSYEGPGRLAFEAGRIVAVEPADTAPDRILLPGFIDLQVNGHDDVDCTTADGADWERMDQLLLTQGVTTWCPTLVTAPLPSFAAPLDRIAAAAARPAERRPHIAGAHLEGPFLGGAPGAHRRDWLAAVDLDWLAALPDIVRVVTLAPELDRALDAIRLLVARGVLVSLGHSTCTYEQARAGADAGARLVTHLFNGMGPLHHREPGLVGAALSDERLTPSLIADLIHVHPAVLRAALAATGCVLVTDAIGWRRDHGGSRVTMTDAPRLADGTLAGSALTMDGAARNSGLPPAGIAAATAERPARLLGLADRGVLQPGLRADVVALTPGLQVEQVWVGGEPVLAGG